MNHDEARRLIPVPELHKLKQIAMGVEIDMLFGKRVLAECIEPMTKMDTLQKSGLLYTPAQVKKDNTPMPTTGIVMGLGAELDPDGPVKVGSMIMFSKHSGSDFIFTDENEKEDSTKKWRILDIEEVICTLRSSSEEPLMSKIVPVIADKESPDVPTMAGVPLIR